MKSSWKFNFFCRNLYRSGINEMFIAGGECVDLKLKNYLELKQKQDFLKVRVFRSSYVSLDYVGLRVLVPGGKGFTSVLVKPEMVGFKFGSFIHTKRFGMGRKVNKVT